MDIWNWLALASICALGAMSPGPSLAVIIKAGSHGGFRAGAAASIAHGAGVAVYATLTALGLAVVLTGTPWLFAGLQWAGALFLAYLGWKALTAKPAPAVDTGEKPGPAAAMSPRRAAANGFAVSFLNPKIAVFFTALFSQFVGPHQALTTKLGMAGLAAGIDAAWYLLVTALMTLASRSERFQRARQLAGSRIEKAFGLLLLALAARLVWSI